MLSVNTAGYSQDKKGHFNANIVKLRIVSSIVEGGKSDKIIRSQNVRYIPISFKHKHRVEMT